MTNGSLPIRLVLGIAVAAVLVTACGGPATPTQPSIEAVYTSAAQTVAVQLTQTALVMPTLTPSETSTPYPTITLPSAGSASPFPTLAGGLPPASSGCSAIYVSDVTIPDNTSMTPGQAFTKTWRLQNNGSCTWTTAFKIAFISGESMGGASTAITTSVSPNQNIDVSVAMTAPNKSGTLTGIWRMMDDKGLYFGGTVTVVIQIGGSTQTVTQSGTPPTRTMTRTPVPGNTATPTVTPLPSSTPTISSTPTETMTPTTPAT